MAVEVSEFQISPLVNFIRLRELIPTAYMQRAVGVWKLFTASLDFDCHVEDMRIFYDVFRSMVKAYTHGRRYLLTLTLRELRTHSRSRSTFDKKIVIC